MCNPYAVGAINRSAPGGVRLEALPGLHDEIARLRAALEVESKARSAADQLVAVVGAKLEAAERRADDIEAHAGKVEAALQAQVTGLAADLADIKKREAAVAATVKVEKPAASPKRI